MRITKVTHGGKREGAGRKRKGNEIMQIRISPEVAEKIREESKLRGCSYGEAVEQLINIR